MASNQDSGRKRREQSERAQNPEEVNATDRSSEDSKNVAAAPDIPQDGGAGNDQAQPASTHPAPQSRTQEYLVAHTRALLPASVAPLNLQMLSTAIQQGNIPGVEFRRTLSAPPGIEQLGLMSAVPTSSREIIVAAMDDARAEQMRQEPQLEIEPNLFLELAPATPSLAPTHHVPLETVGKHPSVFRPLSTDFVTTIQVVAPNGTPLPRAEVYVFGAMQHAGITDANGRVQLSLFGESSFTLTGLYVKPKFGFWDQWIERPELVSGAAYTITLRAFADTFLGFPGQEVVDWGLKAMRFDQLAANQSTGAGIKVAVVDSGAAGPTHQELQGQVALGFNILTQTQNGWENDELAHGSHCAGVIAGRDNGRGIRGIAPKAQLAIYKLFPGGQFDHLIDAIDRCIRDGVDIVNLSLGADQVSQRVDERLRMAKENGVACIVAAGNSAGPVKYPASSAHVLAVAAIGQQGTFPVDSYHANQVFGAPDANGYFSAAFSCFGPEVDVCAPGVAVLSSVPPDDYAAWDGTSMAGPHVAGLAALLLAHHPDFQTAPFNQRNAQRVDRLFAIIKQSARPMNLGGTQRTGAGLPDAVAAFSPVVGPGTSTGTGASSGTGPPSNVQALLNLWK